MHFSQRDVVWPWFRNWGNCKNFPQNCRLHSVVNLLLEGELTKTPVLDTFKETFQTVWFLFRHHQWSVNGFLGISILRQKWRIHSTTTSIITIRWILSNMKRILSAKRNLTILSRSIFSKLVCSCILTLSVVVSRQRTVCTECVVNCSYEGV